MFVFPQSVVSRGGVSGFILLRESFQEGPGVPLASRIDTNLVSSLYRVWKYFQFPKFSTFELRAIWKSAPRLQTYGVAKMRYIFLRIVLDPKNV